MQQLSLTKFNGLSPKGTPINLTWDSLCDTELQLVDNKFNASATGFYSLRAPDYYRKAENVISRHCLVLDLDKTTLTFDEIVSGLSGYQALIMTSWSHNPEQGQNKFRVVINTDRDINIDEYPKLLEAFINKEPFLKNQIDTVVKDASRLFFDWSIHPDRKHLARKEIINGSTLAVDELLALVEEAVEDLTTVRKNITDNITDFVQLKESNNEIEKLLSALDCISPDVGRGTGSIYKRIGEKLVPEECYWLGIILAIRNLNWGCGLDIAKTWSKKSERYSDIGFENAWKASISSPPTVRSIYKKAIDNGWSEPLFTSLFGEQGSEYEVQQLINKLNSNAAPQGIKDDIDEINDKFGWDFNEMNLYSIDRGRYVLKDRFQTQYSTRSIVVNDKRISLGAAWLNHPRRRQISKIVMEPGLPESLPNNVVNSWKGFNYQPIKGDVKPFITLLKNLIPDAEECLFVEKWFAKLIQEPATKYNVALVLWSPIQGVGKNLAVETIGNLFNERHFSVVGQEVFADAFTDWQANKCLIVCDEVSSSDKRHIADRVKGWITSTKNNINCKHEPKFTQPNYIKYVFLSNHPDAVFFDNTDRRFFAVQTSSHQLSKEEVKDFIHWRNDTGYSALLEYLLNLDTSEFNPSAPAPSSASKLNMVEANKSDLETWFDQYIDHLLDKGVHLVNAEKMADNYFISRNTKCSCKTIANLLGRRGYKKLSKQARDTNTKVKARIYALKNYGYYETLVDTELAVEYVEQNKLGRIYL